MMNQEDIYNAEQELVRFNELMSKEILTQEEYEFCKAWDAEEAKNLFPVHAKYAYKGRGTITILRIDPYVEPLDNL